MKKLFIEAERCLSCLSCELACILRLSSSHSLYSVEFNSHTLSILPRISVEPTTFGPFPLRCYHCEYPPCVDACIAGAIQKENSKDIIWIDESRCVGCFMCVMVCPFGAIIPNLAKKIAYKCDGCKDEDEPACVLACPTGALGYYESTDLLRNKRLRIAKIGRK